MGLTQFLVQLQLKAAAAAAKEAVQPVFKAVLVVVEDRLQEQVVRITLVLLGVCHSTETQVAPVIQPMLDPAAAVVLVMPERLVPLEQAALAVSVYNLVNLHPMGDHQPDGLVAAEEVALTQFQHRLLQFLLRVQL